MIDLPIRSAPRRRAHVAAGSVVLLGLTLGLSACGGSGSTAPASSPSASATAGGALGGQGAQGGQQMQQIQACLKAAGITVTRPSGPPDGGAGGGTPPSGRPSRGAAPSGAPSGGPGGGRGGINFDDAKVQAALKACGITVPTARPTAQPAG